MKASIKFTIIALFALLGAFVSATQLPPVVDRLWESLVERELSSPTLEGPVSNPAGAPVRDGTPAQLPNFEARNQVRPPVNLFAMILLGLVVGATVGSALLRIGERMSSAWDKLPAGERITYGVGIFAGLLVGVIVSTPFFLFFQNRPEGASIAFGLIIGCAACVTWVLRGIDNLPWLDRVETKRRTGRKIMDTNVLIDGRVLDILKSGFLDGDLYVPNFVLQELQNIADSSDALRRQRGRRGLEVLRQIQAEFPVEVGAHDKLAGPANEPVDARLVKLAKSLGADLVSNDFNLNRVASIQSVKVLNVNDLALAMRPNVLPGELLEVALIREGNQYGQGVGYLDDGTMVVVENAREMIGSTVNVPVTQVIQTERGKMIFADASESVTESDPGPLRRRGNRGQR
jgi:uncharacterized protein YacL